MSDQNCESKELQILKAAEHELLTKGYDGARTTSIAKAAGVTHAMLHYYFRTKEQLFERIVDKKMSEIVPLITFLFGNDKLPLIERIKEAVSVHFDFVAANPDLPRFLINEVLPNEKRCIWLRAKLNNVYQMFGHLQHEVDEAASRGEIEKFNVLLLFQSILSINVFPIIMGDFVENILESESAVKSFMAERKAENIELIMRRIRKK